MKENILLERDIIELKISENLKQGLPIAFLMKKSLDLHMRFNELLQNGKI